MTKYFWCFLGFALLTAPMAEAGDLTLFGGAHLPGELTLGSAGGAAGQLTDPRNFGVFGLRFNRSNGPVGMESTIAYSPNFLDSSARAFILSTNLLVGLPAPVVRPYGTAGFGFLHAGGEGPASVGAKFGFNYGGGVKVTPGGPVGIRFDVRGYSILGLESQTLKILETSVGLLIAF
jgi:hypothetical protein